MFAFLSEHDGFVVAVVGRFSLGERVVHVDARDLRSGGY
jgi:hypothetical protein